MKLKYLISLFAALALTACQPQSKPAGEAQTEAEPVADPLHRTPEFNLRDSLQVGSHQWVYTIRRQSDDTLPIVTDEEGQRHADNFYQLDISRDGSAFFSRRLTKQDFASRLSQEFRQYGILDGCRFNRYEDGKLHFTFCVSYPESDEYSPFLLIIGPDGSCAIEPDEMLDDLGDIEMSEEMMEKLHDIEEAATEEE